MPKLSYTIYAQQAHPKYKDGLVGIDWSKELIDWSKSKERGGPTWASLTCSEVHSLIDQLQQIAREMRAGYTKPD